MKPRILAGIFGLAIWLSLLLMGGAVNARAQCVASPSGLVDLWSAEGNVIDSIGTNNGTLVGGAMYAPGEVGQAFSFDGSTGYVSIPDSPSLDQFTTNITIEAWIKVNQTNSDYNWRGLVTKGNSSWRMQETPDVGRIYFAGSGLSTDLSGNRNLNDEQWHHVATIYDGTNIYLYVDGVLDASTPATGTIWQNNSPVEIGNTYNNPNNYCFDGLIDAVSIYNRALSAKEIAAIYASSSAGKCELPPIITSQPTNETLLLGQNAVFNVAVTGIAPFTYQWSFNGTNLVGATNATLTVPNVQPAQTGEYSVQVGNNGGTTNSANVALTVVLPPTITLQPVSVTALTYTSAGFTVAATGTGPLSYHWQKNGTNLVDGGNISGSATASLSLSTVSTTDAGNYQAIISSPYATTNSAVAVLTVPSTIVSLGTASAMSGNTITIPVNMDTLGVENAFLGSVSYDPTKLVLQGIQLGTNDSGAFLEEIDTQTNNGNVGIVLFFDWSPIPVGPQQIAQLVFSTLPVTNTATVNLTFSDTPTLRQLADVNANPLPLITQSTSITLDPAEYEADVYPRFNGDHQVNLSDWLEVGRMVAGLDTPTNTDELLRADCAPRNAPDGVLSVADWVQAGRYVLGLDPLTLVPAVNPEVQPQVQAEVQAVGQSKARSALKAVPHNAPNPTRILQVATVTGQRGQSVSVPVQLVTIANENAVGLTVDYNPALLTLTGVTRGTNTTGAQLNVNSNPLTGKVGIALALSPGLSLTAGTNQVAVLQFSTHTNAVGTLGLTLDSSVVVAQVADKSANVLATSLVSGAVITPPAPTILTMQSGGNLSLAWPVGSGTYQLLTATTPVGPWLPIGATFTTNGNNVTVSVQATNQQQYFRLQGQ